VDVPTAVYRLYAGANDQQPLYIGVAKNPEARWAQHRKSKPWWAEVERKTVEWHPTRLAALTAEAGAIRDEMPVYNLATPAPDDPLHWPPPNWSELQAEGVRQARAARAEASLCPDCSAPLPPLKTCPGCGREFYRTEAGRSDTECCSQRCSARVRKRRERERKALK
jgi:predicted GIY-YIG superfamily endonuclease